ncbi:phage tail protein [Mailhella massiliensis]|uniref:phage tail protein n=1 Tax=Mailhella massiliensis TaxID=1903261 RepID=UPI0023F25E22|nr:phage tail protein [Mailhella massiliensis]
MNIGSLGDIPFETSASLVSTPRDISRKISSRYETHYVLGAKPRLEYLSEELDSITMQIRLVEMGELQPEAELARLAALCRQGQAVPLILMGVNFGNVIIESVTERWRGKGKSGPFCIDATLELKEYV